MDERAIPNQIGNPIPAWDLQHRLPIDAAVGPDCWDGGTIFRINSTYMDVTEQPYLQRQWTAAATLIACCGIAAGFWTYYLTRILYPKNGGLFGDLFCLALIVFFSYLAFKSGRDEFFGLKRRPIRFNRLEKKLYSIRRRRFFSKSNVGDITWEATWDKNSLFCIHKEKTNFGLYYHIRHYTVDGDGNVTSAFSIGRAWFGNLTLLLAQWNYWCWYMNRGPADLPKPMLFHTEHESLRESFLFAMYGFGMVGSPTYRIAMMPFTLLWACFRILAIATCRNPVWPKSVELLSVVAAEDPYNQPRGDTPVGWAETALAQERHDYPYSSKKEMDNWHGEKDGEANASLWAEDAPSKI